MKETGLQKYIDKLILFAHHIYSGDCLERWKIQMVTRKRLGRLYKDKGTRLANPDYDVIFVADEYYGFGGLADRLRGIISLYDFCLSNDLSFGIYFNHPFKLSKYLEPNIVNWEVRSLDRNPDLSCPYLVDTPNTLKGGIAEYQKRRFEGILDYKGIRQVHCYTNADLVDSPERFSSLFSALFRPSAVLQRYVDDNKKNIGGSYISISFRFVQLLGDFKDCISDTLPEEQQKRLIEKCIDAIYKIHSMNFTPKVLVTADSQKFLDYVSRIDFAYVIPGKVAHLNYSEDDNAHLKTFVDFIMISSAQKVYLARMDKMFKSGFARKAAMSSNVPFEEYIIK